MGSRAAIHHMWPCPGSNNNNRGIFVIEPGDQPAAAAAAAAADHPPGQQYGYACLWAVVTTQLYSNYTDLMPDNLALLTSC